MAWICVGATIALTAYGQIVVKWQVMRRGQLPASLSAKFDYFTHLLLNPWVISVLIAAFVAAISWMAAMSRLQLSQAYPFVGVSFVLVVLLSGIFFDEPITTAKVVGVGLVVAGLAVGSGL